MRLIDADALLDKLSGDDPANMEDYYYNAIKEAPTIEAEPVRHGEWKPTYHTYYNRDGACQIADEWHCSECGCFSADRRNYCPNCWAKMDGGKKE